MISFATLFLGLVFGVQSVDLVVGDSVAAVDILLDGELLETLEKPPWRAQVDLGSDLRPHVLEAVALDELFGELGRVSQRINLPRDPVEVEVAVEETATGAGAVGRLTWQSLIGGEPSMIAITLDGRPIEVDDPGRFELPAYDPELLHVLRAEIEIGGAAFSTAEVVFGGSWVGKSTMALTATAIELTGAGTVKEPGDLNGSLQSRGKSLEVAVVEKESSEIAILRTPAASEALAGLARSRSSVRTFADPFAGRGLEATVLRKWRTQFIWPVSRPGGSEGRRFDLFPHSQHFTERDSDLSSLITGVRSPVLAGDMRLADAVAIAGLTVSASNRRRAVVLIVGAGEADASDATSAVARRFLEYLRVPLLVWSVVPDAPAPEGWGEATDVSSRSKLDKAIRRLLKGLEAQRVVWLRGSHLPNEISLTDQARGIRLAGSSEPSE